MRLDKYEIFARLLPTILTGLPLYVLYYFAFGSEVHRFLGSLLLLSVASGITVLAILTYYKMQMDRFVSKEVFERRVFRDGSHMPTTEYLLHLDRSMSAAMKERVHRKVDTEFQIQIPTETMEQSNEEESRRVVRDVVGMIIQRLRNRPLVHQHNVEYGFARNLLGGSLTGSLLAITNIVVFVFLVPNSIGLVTSLVLLSVYLLIIFFSKRILFSFGRAYCRVLIQEFMAN